MHMLKKVPVGCRLRMVEFVDDHHVELVRLNRCQAVSMEALYRGENVPPFRRALAPHEYLAKGAVGHHGREGRSALLKNFSSMRDKQQRQFALLLDQSA